MTIKGYVLAEVDVFDSEAYKEYVRLSGIAGAKYGAKYLSRGNAIEILEGNTEKLPRVALLEFPSLETARNFYFSEEYTLAKEKRANIAAMRMLLLAGLPD